jgi:hypothetical protein
VPTRLLEIAQRGEAEPSPRREFSLSQAGLQAVRTYQEAEPEGRIIIAMRHGSPSHHV